MKRELSVLLAASLYASVATSQLREAEPAPMLAPPYEKPKAVGNTAEKPPENQILQAYRKRTKGQADRFAIFWNASLPGRISDWQARSRSTWTFDAQSNKGNETENFSGRAQGQYETRQPSYSTTSKKNAPFALQGGLIKSLSRANVKVIDQQLAQRLTDNALEDGSFSRLSPDELRLQMRALSQHADYVIEIFAGPRFPTYGLYSIKILSIKDASIVSAFTTNATPRDRNCTTQWETTAKGYEKIERCEPIELSDVGWELGLEVMQSML